MKINVGAGTLRLEGFTNVDVRAVGSDSRRGHAGNLSFAQDGTVDVVFSHAVFEHVYPAHRLSVLREWSRVLSPEGVIVCIGLPDFESIARHYLDRGPGVTGETFDLFEVYRYTHGHPEMMTEPGWKSFDPFRHENSGPRGYVPQLHKGLFDQRHLSSLLRTVGLTGHLLTYAYAGEKQPINLGFVAGADCDDLAAAEAGLNRIGPATRFIAPGTLSWHPFSDERDPMTEEILRLETRPAASRVRRVARAAKRSPSLVRDRLRYVAG